MQSHHHEGWSWPCPHSVAEGRERWGRCGRYQGDTEGQGSPGEGQGQPLGAPAPTGAAEGPAARLWGPAEAVGSPAGVLCTQVPLKGPLFLATAGPRQDLCPVPRAVTGAAVTSEGCVGTPASPLGPAATPGDVPRDAARARAGSRPFQPSAESPTTDWRASLCHQTRAGRATSRRQPLSALGAAWGDGSVNPVPGSGRSCDEGLPRWRPAQGLAEKLPEYWWSGKGPARPGRPSAAQLGTAGLDPGFPSRCRLLRLPYLQVQREWPLCPQTAVLPSRAASPQCSLVACLATVARPAPRPWGPLLETRLGGGAGAGCALSITRTVQVTVPWGAGH